MMTPTDWPDTLPATTVRRRFTELLKQLGSERSAITITVTPDLITCAKALTNAAVPMGAVIVKREIYDAFMQGPEHAIELYHGYTYSGHPLAAAAAIATLDLLEQEGLFRRAAELAPYFEDAVHSLEGVAHVIDLRNFGLVGAIELEPRPAAPGSRAFDAFVRCYEKNVLVRTTGDTIALSPALIVEKAQIDQLVGTVREVLKTLP
jgi:beta-alanine--pyruvate transaminase